MATLGEPKLNNGGSLASWSCLGYGGSLVLGHAVGVGLCRGVCGSCFGGSSVSWFRGSCRGVCVVGYRHRGHAVGVVGHQFQVMLGCEIGRAHV